MQSKTYPMLINGQSVTTNDSIDIVNPATGKVIGQVPEVDTSAIQSALKAAEHGFKVWSSKTPAERKAIILRYADLLDKNRKRLVSLLIEETGKPQDNAEYDFG
ncbi:MAG: aldehyde dehydrogenase, partial [Planctomycetes bacterium]|nr:aldehyde dehydrogenase [Planctomycetota bacterium]